MRSALRLQEPARDEGKLLREVLHHALHQAGRLRIVGRKRGIERLLADLVAGRVAEWIGAKLAQRLAPFVENCVQRLLAGPVAEVSVLVLQLEIIAVDVHGREARCAVRAEGRQYSIFAGHHVFSS
jgi:hypothetical protein